jgi:hypothetical protein
MKKWEYHFRPIIADDLDMIAFNLRWLGRDGWELAAVIPATGRQLPQAIFKRPTAAIQAE